MKVSFKRKVILHFPTFMIISLIVLVLSYYSHYILNQKLQIIERKDTLFNIILEARRYVWTSAAHRVEFQEDLDG